MKGEEMGDDMKRRSVINRAVGGKMGKREERGKERNRVVRETRRHASACPYSL